MDWITVLSALGGCGFTLAIVEWVRFRRKDKADARLTEADADSRSTDNALRYATKVEERLSAMEEKVDKCELKISVFQQAINCSYRCSNVDNPEKECPVLLHLYDTKKEDSEDGNNQ